MSAYELTPDAISFNATVASLKRGSQWQVASQLFDRFGSAAKKKDDLKNNVLHLARELPWIVSENLDFGLDSFMNPISESFFGLSEFFGDPLGQVGTLFVAC